MEIYSTDRVKCIWDDCKRHFSILTYLAVWNAFFSQRSQLGRQICIENSQKVFLVQIDFNRFWLREILNKPFFTININDKWFRETLKSKNVSIHFNYLGYMKFLKRIYSIVWFTLTDFISRNLWNIFLNYLNKYCQTWLFAIIIHTFSMINIYFQNSI